MAKFATANIRTLALVGHGASGKTTLAEALLHKAGAIQSVGSVERGTTVSDFEALEKTWQHSLRTSVLHLETQDTRVHMIDTPGFPDFIGQAIGALDAVETAAVVINAAAGIEMIASRMMEWARERKLCRLLIVNKIDAENVDLPALLVAIQHHFRQGVPADQPARRQRQACRRLLFQPVGRIRFLVGCRGPPGAGRPGRRGRRGADVALPRAGRDRSRAAACAVREGAARRPSGAGVLRLGEERRRRRRAARRVRKAAAEPGRGQSAAVHQGRGRCRDRIPFRTRPEEACAGACVQGRRWTLSSASSACSACTRER